MPLASPDIPGTTTPGSIGFPQIGQLDGSPAGSEGRGLESITPGERRAARKSLA